jgi:hypothetical protein
MKHLIHEHHSFNNNVKKTGQKLFFERLGCTEKKFLLVLFE